MDFEGVNGKLDQLKQMYPEKFASENRIFRHIRRGDS